MGTVLHRQLNEIETVSTAFALGMADGPAPARLFYRAIDFRVLSGGNQPSEILPREHKYEHTAPWILRHRHGGSPDYRRMVRRITRIGRMVR
jgi:hypothetical protein